MNLQSSLCWFYSMFKWSLCWFYSMFKPSCDCYSVSAHRFATHLERAIKCRSVDCIIKLADFNTCMNLFSYGEYCSDLKYKTWKSKYIRDHFNEIYELGHIPEIREMVNREFLQDTLLVSELLRTFGKDLASIILSYVLIE
jgi:hypothetical protein